MGCNFNQVRGRSLAFDLLREIEPRGSMEELLIHRPNPKFRREKSKNVFFCEFKVTFIYRKFINLYTNKFILIIEDAIDVHKYIYIQTHIRYINSYRPNSVYFDISLFV